MSLSKEKVGKLILKKSQIKGLGLGLQTFSFKIR